ncbi:MAG TPA: hypothetical protein VLH19_02615 [Patescibacteria group bacterium]|nr:hypothetical protein [Patescibacteria group bacterium]
MNALKISALVLSGSLLLSACSGGKPAAAPGPTARPRKADVNVNLEPVANRPFVRLSPRSDGKAISMTLLSEKKGAKDLEYEVEYSSGSLLQGAFGSVDSLANLPITKEILLGSCSTGGKCTYNTNVTGGTLTLRFGTPDYTMKQEWSYAEKAKKLTNFVSRDGKFTLGTAKAKNSSDYVIIYQTPGYPGTIAGTIVAGPYEVAPAESITGTVSVSVRVPSDTKAATLMAWNGKAWVDYKGTLANQVLNASGPSAEVFVVVTK